MRLATPKTLAARANVPSPNPFLKSVFIRVHPWFTSLLVLACLSATAADPLSDALQKGLFEEEANHDFDAAIKAYQSVIDQTAEQRKLTATAVFRLGECYRKLNKTNDAITQFNRVTREFSDQTNLLAASQKTLIALGQTSSQPAFADRLHGVVRAAAPQSQPDPQDLEIERLKALAKDSPDLVNARDDQGDTPLHRAASRGQLKVAEFLLSNNADVNAPNKNRTTPFHYAVWFGNKNIVEVMLARGANINALGSFGNDNPEKITPYSCQPLHVAVYRGNQAIAELLLQHKAQVNGLDYRGRTPLHFAVDQGFLGLARLLISNGANLNIADERGHTPATIAGLTGYEHVLRLLLENGADVNAQDREGNTLAHYTVLQRSPGALKAVIDRKPDLAIQNRSGQTPLLVAVLSGGSEAVELLLKSGADPNARDERGLFPLMAAVDAANKEAVQLLLAHKADPNQTNFDGMTALNRAFARGLDYNPARSGKSALREIADLLRQAGANDNTARVPFIGLARGDKVLNAQFVRQDVRGLNRFTLFQFLHAIYNGRGANEESSVNSTALKFPDFTRVQIQRLVDGQKDRKKIDVNLEAALSSGDCTANVPLEWGDIIDIPELDHKVNESWPGLAAEIRQAVSRCLEREVTITVKRQTTTFKLRPAFFNSSGVVLSDQANLPVRKVVASAEPGGSQELVSPIPVLRLKNVLYASGMLRASSDLKHVLVVRKMPDTGERLNLYFNVEATAPSDDVVLRDGDAIYVDEK
ncbi:MAG TPA: ankyrin repeat domain-containing protein [Verrucomicrobiae bacterium]|nr:ankyrin repeat domain-containing protein [Verrucomicrobiae bacterium]